MKRTFLFLLILGQAAMLPAQSFFTPTPQYLNPGFRGGASTEYSRWDVFYSPYAGLNYPDMAAPNGTDGYFSESGLSPSVLPGNANPDDPYAFWNTSNPGLTQTLNHGQFLTSPGISGNIYSFSGSSAYEISDATPYTLGTVMIQWQTEGTLIDLSTLKLVYNVGGGDIELSATNLITEYKSSGSSFGGLMNRTAAQWDLSGLGITSYKVTFASSESSNSFQELLLDTSASYSEAVPSARTWDGGGGSSLWSSAANWSGDSMTVAGGNVRFSTGNSVVVDSNRTVGELVLDGPTGFTLSNSGGAVLKINTGITANPGSAANYTISAPVTMGAFNLFTLNGNTDLTISGAISGSTGYSKRGDGTLRLTGNNTFTGSIDIDGGTTIVSGTNAYTGTTAVASGALVLKGNALNGVAGTLGNATTNVVVGLDEATYGVKDEAALLVEGDYTVSRNITMATGANAKAIGAQNTSAGATYSGSVTLESAASNVHFRAVNASDKVTFTGAISGGGTSKTLIKDGAGTVVFSGTNKTYGSSTTVSAGTLVIATGTSLTGNGSMTVASSARLTVNGILGGSGALIFNGGIIGGSGTINKAMTIDAGDILSPGNSPGTLNTAAETWGGGGILLWEMNDIDAGQGTSWDFLNVTGGLSLTATTLNKFTIRITSLDQSNIAGLVHDFNAANSGSWKILTASGGITGFDAAKFDLNLTGFQNGLSGAWNISQTGNDLFLNYAAIPEPSTYALLGLGGLLLWTLHRRRKAA